MIVRSTVSKRLSRACWCLLLVWCWNTRSLLLVRCWNTRSLLLLALRMEAGPGWPTFWVLDLSINEFAFTSQIDSKWVNASQFNRKNFIHFRTCKGLIKRVKPINNSLSGCHCNISEAPTIHRNTKIYVEISSAVTTGNSHIFPSYSFYQDKICVNWKEYIKSVATEMTHGTAGSDKLACDCIWMVFMDLQ